MFYQHQMHRYCFGEFVYYGRFVDTGKKGARKEFYRCFNQMD